jgi:hypothetical protein
MLRDILKLCTSPILQQGRKCYYVTREIYLLSIIVTYTIKLVCSHIKSASAYLSETFVFWGSRDSSVGIATSYGLEDRGVGVRVPVV